MTFSERLEILIKRNNLSQKELAKLTGIREATISEWKANGTLPRVDTAVSIAKVLNTDVEYLVTGESNNISNEIVQKISKLDLRDQQDIVDFIEIKLRRKDIIPFSKETLDDVIYHKWGVQEIPLLGETSATIPDLAPTRPWSNYLFKGDPSNYLCATVKDDSMSEAYIVNGDHVLFEKANKPMDGRIMLIHYNKYNTLKRIKVVKNEVYMLWEDGSKKEVKLSDFQIQGVLVAVFHAERS